MSSCRGFILVHDRGRSFDRTPGLENYTLPNHWFYFKSLGAPETVPTIPGEVPGTSSHLPESTNTVGKPIAVEDHSKAAVSCVASRDIACVRVAWPLLLSRKSLMRGDGVHSYRTTPERTAQFSIQLGFPLS